MSSDPAKPAGRRRGLLIVISGPSGAGKTSICNAILERVPGTIWSVSVTTRKQRQGGRGTDCYEFVSREEFRRREAAGDFLESAEYVGELYGTPRVPVEEALGAGRSVVMEIDVQGGMQVAERVPDSVRVFVLPPDRESLRVRLEGRQTEAQEQVARRLSKADGEIAMARESGCYQHFVINDQLEATIEQVRGIIEKESGRHD